MSEEINYEEMTKKNLIKHLKRITDVINEMETPFEDYTYDEKVEYINNYFERIGIPDLYRIGKNDERLRNFFYGIQYKVSDAKDTDYMDKVFNKNEVLKIFNFAKRFKDSFDNIDLWEITFYDMNAEVAFKDSTYNREYILDIYYDENYKIELGGILIRTGGFLEYQSGSETLKLANDTTFCNSLEYYIELEEDNMMDIEGENAPNIIISIISDEMIKFKNKINEILIKL